MEPELNTRLTKIRAEALQMTNGNQKEAERWLNTPLPILGNETPIEHAHSDAGAEDVSSLIARIMHGVFS